MFNAEYETRGIIEFIKAYFKEHHLSGVVIGISGGKDSAVTAGLFTMALGKDKVIGITLPCHSKDQDKSDAHIISDHFGFHLLNQDLTSVYDAFKTSVGGFGMESIDSDINIKPRLRMASLYYLAQLLSTNKKEIYIVAGTSNLCEIYVGYFTKGGDNVHDICLLGDLTVDEVIAIGKHIGVPEVVLFKAPSDGISNLNDEDKLGVTYQEIAAYIKDGTIDNKGAEAKIIKLHQRNLHKLSAIPTYRKKNY